MRIQLGGRPDSGGIGFPRSERFGLWIWSGGISARINGFGFKILPPWNRGLPSERFGFRPTYFRFLGWRIVGLARRV